MEIFNRETNPRDGDDDEEEVGATGSKKPTKESWQPGDTDQDKYHSLHHGAAGEFFLPKQEGMFDHLLEKPKDYEENEEEKNEKSTTIEDTDTEYGIDESENQSVIGSLQAETNEEIVEQLQASSVSLEPEPTHKIEGFRQEEQFEGYTPGPVDQPHDKQEHIAGMQPQQRAAQEVSGSPAREQQHIPSIETTQRDMDTKTPEAPEHTVSGISAETTSTGLSSEEESDQDKKPDAEAARRAIEQATEAMAAEKPQHVEQDAWRRYVVDEHGHEVHEAMRYGREYDEERAQEISFDASAGSKRHGQDQAVFGGGSSWQQPDQTPDQYEEKNNSGQTPADHSLPSGTPTLADWQHQLPEKHQNPLASALTSPWLFLFLSLILLAYFIATLL